jgi:hypothetical protein
MASPNTGEIKKMVQAAHAKQGTPQKVPSLATGTVHSIEMHADHPGVARVRIKHGQPGKVGKSPDHHNLGFDSRPESTAHIHVQDANRLKIGQKIHLRPHDGEYGSGTSDEFTQ